MLVLTKHSVLVPFLLCNYCVHLYLSIIMSLSHPNNLLLLQKPRRRFYTQKPSVSLDPRLVVVTRANKAILCSQGLKERIRELFTKVDLSVSSYDTAWVAMVPSPKSPQFPYFPECVKWLLENQLPDGSWGLSHCHPLLIKDALSSTLACVLALKRWNIGEEHMKKGLHFIGSNFSSATDEKQHSPIGFDIIFPGMIQYAKDMGLNLPLSPTTVDDMLHKRVLDFKRSYGINSDGRNAYLAYVAEGLGKLLDWGEVMKYQRKNGSLFNSPSTTAAALTHLQDANCLKYLHSLLERFGNAVPTAYPLDIYARLCMVDTLQRLGIDRHFRDEIRIVLDETYRCWLEMDEDIFLESATCAMAFRILRMNGYDISSDALARFAEEDQFFDSHIEHQKNMGTVLELFKASQIMIFPNELVLEKQNSWASKFLKQELSNTTGANRFCKHMTEEVDYALKFPYYANLERLENRRNMEHYNVDNLMILKTSYRSLNIGNRDFLELAAEEFDICQSIHRKELKFLERWIEENRLDKLKFARQKLTYCYFSAAAVLFSPEQSDARMSWAKNGVLTTVVDDFFDIGGSREELINLIKLVEKWDENYATECCSEQVEIIFSAIRNSICEIGDRAFTWQGRSVTDHLIEIWLNLLKSMMREAEWQVKNKLVPTMEEYLSNGYVSFALGPIVLPALYLIGPKLSEEVVRDSEYHNLFKLLSTCGRLLNDVQSFKREDKEGKANAVSLHMIHGCGVINEEESVRAIRGIIESSRRELLRLVLQTKGSVVPRECKDLFWKMSKVCHLFYMKKDGFTSPQEMVSAVNAVIHEPLKIASKC